MAENRLQSEKKFMSSTCDEYLTSGREIKKLVWKSLRVWTKNEEIMKIFKKILRFFDKISMENWRFSQF